MKTHSFITLVLTLLILFCVRISAQEADPLTRNPAAAREALERYISEAIENNAELRAIELRYEAAKQRAPQAAALPDAKVGIGYFAVPVETRLGPQQTSLSLSQSFPWFGTLGAEEDAALAHARQRYKQYVDARNRLITEVRDTWYRLYVLERSVELTREHLRLLNTLRDLALVRFEATRVPFSHILRLDMELEELDTRLRYFEDSRTPLLVEFTELLNREQIVDQIVLPDSLEIDRVAADTEGLERMIAEQNPRLAMLEEESAYWDAKSEAARKKGYPSFTLGLTYTFIGERTDMDVAENGRNAVIPQLGLSFPIFGSRYPSMEEEALLRKESARSERENLRQRLNTTLHRHLRDLRDAYRRFELANNLVQLSTRTYRVQMEEYSGDRTTLDEVLSVERDILRHALEREKARADINRAVDELFYLTAQEQE